MALNEPMAEFGTAWIGEGVELVEEVPLPAADTEEVVTVLRLDEVAPVAAAEDDTLAADVKVELLSTTAVEERVEATAELVTAGALALEEAAIEVA